MNRLPLSQRWPRADEASAYVDLLLAWARRLTPGARRLRHRILVTSQPKAGTNLLLKTLGELPGPRVTRMGVYRDSLPESPGGVPIGVDWPTEVDARRLVRRLASIPPGGVVVAHVPYSLGLDRITADLDMRVAVIVRDPRDVAVSLGPYVLARPRHFLHERFRVMTEDQRLEAAISGVPPDGTGTGLLDLGTRMRSALAWRDSPRALVVRFEDLVGSGGGGDDAVQRDVVGQLATHVGAPIDDALGSEVAARLFGGTDTFRRGRIAGWRETLTAQQQDLARSIVGEDLLTAAGYPTS